MKSAPLTSSLWKTLSAWRPAAFGLVVTMQAIAQTTFIPMGATWKYLDDGSNQGTAWQSPTFSDASWASGPAQLGYGDGDEQTIVSFGPNSGAKYITTYFRTTFNVPNPASVPGLKLQLLRDDGAVVYINGVEVLRSNMAASPTPITHTTPASANVSGASETTLFSFTLNPAVLVAGDNVIAVEVHQDVGTSSDTSFDLRLTDGVSAPLVTRGPHLQKATSSSILVRWRTDVASNSRVNFGTAAGNLDNTTDNATSTTEHSVQTATSISRSKS